MDKQERKDLHKRMIKDEGLKKETHINNIRVALNNLLSGFDGKAGLNDVKSKQDDYSN